MNNHFFVFALLLVTNFSFAQENAEKTLMKTLDVQEASTILFNFKIKGIKNTPKDHAYLQMEINVKTNMPSSIMDQLIKAGRYNLMGYKDADGKYTVTAPNLDKHVIVRGVDLDEEFNIVSESPSRYVVKGNSLEKEVDPMLQELINRSTTAEEKAALIAKSKLITVEIRTKVKIKSKPKKNMVISELKPGDIKIDGKDLEIQ